MVSTFTTNIQLEEPARGDQVGTWDTPVNNNMTLLDKVVGAITSISLGGSNVVLSSPQYQSKTIIFNSTLTGNVTITFPTSFTKSYEVYNFCTGSSAFSVTLQTTAGGTVIGAPPGETVNITNDGANLRYVNLDRIGGYWDYAGSSVPNWVSVCSIAPYLNCDGSTFSAATYPVLAMILGSTTLPDTRGRVRAGLNQGTGRLSAGGLNGNTIFAGGGADTITLLTSQIPAHTHPIIISDPGHTHTHNAQTGATTTGGGGFSAGNNAAATINSAVTGITATSSINAGGGGAHAVVQPTYIGGLTLIRAA